MMSVTAPTVFIAAMTSFTSAMSLLRFAQLTGEFHIFAAEIGMHVAEPGDVAARARQAIDQTDSNRIADIGEYDGNGNAHLLLRADCRARPGGYQHLGAALHQIADHSRDLTLIVD